MSAKEQLIKAIGEIDIELLYVNIITVKVIVQSQGWLRLVPI